MSAVGEWAGPLTVLSFCPKAVVWTFIHVSEAVGARGGWFVAAAPRARPRPRRDDGDKHDKAVRGPLDRPLSVLARPSVTDPRAPSCSREASGQASRTGQGPPLRRLLQKE